MNVIGARLIALRMNDNHHTLKLRTASEKALNLSVFRLLHANRPVNIYFVIYDLLKYISRCSKIYNIKYSIFEANFSN